MLMLPQQRHVDVAARARKRRCTRLSIDLDPVTAGLCISTENELARGPYSQ